MSETKHNPEAEQAPIDTSDAAWVTIPAKQNAHELAKLVDDIEAIIRVNPYYVYKRKWQKTGDSCFHVEYSNLSNSWETDQKFCVRRESDLRRVIEYQDDLKKRTVMEIESTEFGSRLVITDDYEGVSDSEKEARQDEVDKSLKAWGQSLYSYFLRWHRLSWIPGWKWYTRKVWIPMKPSARRITYMLLMMELAFVGLFFFSMLILWVEQNYN